MTCPPRCWLTQSREPLRLKGHAQAGDRLGSDVPWSNAMPGGPASWLWPGTVFLCDAAHTGRESPRNLGRTTDGGMVQCRTTHARRLYHCSLAQH
jgi:hypothetical protein